MTKSIVLLGGGIDSLATLESASLDDVTCLHFDCGTPRSTKAAKAIASYYKLPIMTRSLKTALGNVYWGSLQTENYYVPDRNLVLLSIASALGKSLGFERIYYGAARGAPWIYDITENFVTRLNLILALDKEFPMVVRAPFTRYSKPEVIRYLVSKNSPIHLTYSCYRENFLPCRECSACLKRAESFKLAGVEDVV